MYSVALTMTYLAAENENKNFPSRGRKPKYKKKNQKLCTQWL